AFEVVRDVRKPLARAEAGMRLVVEVRCAAERVDTGFECHARTQRWLFEEQRDLLAGERAAEVRGTRFEQRGEVEHGANPARPKVGDGYQVFTPHRLLEWDRSNIRRGADRLRLQRVVPLFFADCEWLECD